MRTNELEADERRSKMVAEEAPWLLSGTVVVIPGGVWSAEWSHKHPFGVWPRKAGAMTVVRGSGLLSQVIERGR